MRLSIALLGITTLAVAQDTTGKVIFTSKGICYACHGANAKGTPLAPDLTDGKWLNIDGSVADQFLAPK